MREEPRGHGTPPQRRAAPTAPALKRRLRARAWPPGAGRSRPATRAASAALSSASRWLTACSVAACMASRSAASAERLASAAFSASRRATCIGLGSGPSTCTRATAVRQPPHVSAWRGDHAPCVLLRGTRSARRAAASGRGHRTSRSRTSGAGAWLPLRGSSARAWACGAGPAPPPAPGAPLPPPTPTAPTAGAPAPPSASDRAGVSAPRAPPPPASASAPAPPGGATPAPAAPLAPAAGLAPRAPAGWSAPSAAAATALASPLRRSRLPERLGRISARANAMCSRLRPPRPRLGAGSNLPCQEKGVTLSVQLRSANRCGGAVRSLADMACSVRLPGANLRR